MMMDDKKDEFADDPEMDDLEMSDLDDPDLDDEDDDSLDIDLDLDDDDSFDDNGGGGKFAEAWRSNPLVKIGVIAGGIIFVVFVLSMFGGGDDAAERSRVAGGSDVNAVASGTENASPAYIEAIQESNEAKIENAFATGDSAIPVPIDSPQGRVDISAPQAQSTAEDPLARWRRLQEERLARELEEERQGPTSDPVFDAQPVGPDPAIQALSEIMSQQMQSILQNQATVQTSYASVSGSDFLEREAQLQAQQFNATGGQFGSPGAQQINANQPLPDPLVPAGEIVYAQLITEANSDIRGPILAEIAGGPLSGSRVIGNFSIEQELLVLNFNTIVIDGVSQRMNAVAVDPGTAMTGMATDVDLRLVRRVLLPGVAAFIEGAAQAISDSGRTTITVEGGAAVSAEDDADNEQEIASGIEEAGREARRILDQFGRQTNILVRVEAGTPIGILLIEPVFDPSEAPNASGQFGSGFNNNAGAAAAPSATPQIVPNATQLAPFSLEGLSNLSLQ